jgi:hypothetical protein
MCKTDTFLRVCADSYMLCAGPTNACAMLALSLKTASVLKVRSHHDLHIHTRVPSVDVLKCMYLEACMSARAYTYMYIHIHTVNLCDKTALAGDAQKALGFAPLCKGCKVKRDEEIPFPLALTVDICKLTCKDSDWCIGFEIDEKKICTFLFEATWTVALDPDAPLSDDAKKTTTVYFV